MLLLGEFGTVWKVDRQLGEAMLMKRRALPGWHSEAGRSVTILNRTVELHEIEILRMQCEFLKDDNRTIWFSYAD